MYVNSVPEQLKNIDDAYCFESCLGMSLAHHDRLGRLALRDIVAAISQPDEEVTPMNQALSWLHNFGLKVEYIEEYRDDAAEFIDSLQKAGISYTDLSPSTKTAIERVDNGEAVITQINYEEDAGQSDFELNHVVFLSPLTPGETILLVDPDGMAFGLEDLSFLWGRYPNLIAITPKDK